MSSNRTQNQKAKGKAPVKEPALPKPDTTAEDMKKFMHNAKVRLVVVEALGGGNSAPADPRKVQMGKKKNHWALRLILSHPIYYRKEGRDRKCLSVRVSIEHPPGSLICQDVTLKAMENDEETSTSAYVSFYFEVTRANSTVKEFIAVAKPLLPFRYIVVARSLDSTPGAGGPAGRGSNAGRSGRDQELSEHPNGCRDFTAQWFYLLHKAGFVPWEAQSGRHRAANIQPIRETEAFHHLIGYRYSPERVDKAPICKADFQGEHIRVESLTVELIMNPEAGRRTKDGRYMVELPYYPDQPPVQTFRRS